MSRTVLRSLCAGLACIIIGGWFFFSLHQQAKVPMRLVASTAKPHFFVHYEVLYGPEGHRQPLDVEEIVLSPNGRVVGAGVSCPDPMLQLGPQFWEIATKRVLDSRRGDYSWFRYNTDFGVHQTKTKIKGVLNKEGFTLRDLRTGHIIKHYDEPKEDHCTTWTFSSEGKTLWWADDHQRIFWRSIE